ncbi:uncharacterized protein LOC108594949 [Drosophila busckii]|uniref:uncharacterized protein LOC108594949 n=1 Tax=Drosophila busckii TaxID=30019 RepID=UPI00083F158F|nr:uncharacterized protein LOC108594949 [Drosophila busckii]
MYWYQMKNPMLSARQQSGNYPMKHRYRSAPIDMTPYASYRNMFRSPYHSSSAKGLLPYNIMSVPIPSTVAPIMAPSTWNFENKPQAVTVSENITSCKEELSQNPLAEGAVTIMPSENLKYSSNFFLNTMAPTTAIPYKQHSTHSFFTLDDVWIPQSPVNTQYCVTNFNHITHKSFI